MLIIYILMVIEIQYKSTMFIFRTIYIYIYIKLLDRERERLTYFAYISRPVTSISFWMRSQLNRISSSCLGVRSSLQGTGLWSDEEECLSRELPHPMFFQHNPLTNYCTYQFLTPASPHASRIVY